MQILLPSLVILLAYMSVLFVVSLVRHDNGTADIGYGIGFSVVTIAAFVQAPNFIPLALVFAVLAFIWGVRLAVRIFIKNNGKTEDFRYRAWREEWGNTFVLRSFLQVYMLQGAVIFLVALPLLLAFAYPAQSANVLLVVLGIVLWCTGFFFEAMGDFQLDRFLKDPANKGKIMTVGLWKYSRHPNYFGESMMWFGIAIGCAGLSSIGVLGFVSPLLITFLLLKVSGVPLLEKRFAGNSEWEAYKARTSVFVPLPPKT